MPRMVVDLHALLRSAGVPGPYVLVGHSYGGLMVRLFAQTYPSKTAGLVFVDAFGINIERLFGPGCGCGMSSCSTILARP